MFFRPSIALSALAAFSLASAQSIPSSLSAGFDPDSISLQVSFSGDASTGFSEPTTLTAQEASTTPSFALGDASGVNTAISFMILLVDTTSSATSPILHYLQKDFKASGDETQISSSTSPSVAYSKPGAFGETGNRNYVFLMYQQRGSVTTIPQSGKSFDISSFQTSNGLKDPLAGVAMGVNLGGSASDGSGSGGSSSNNNNNGNTQTQQTSTTAASQQETQAPATTSTTQQETQQASQTQTDNQAQQTTLATAAASSSTADSTSTIETDATAAASIGAAGSGAVGGVVSSIPSSVGGADSASSTTSSGTASSTGAAGRVEIGSRGRLGGALGALVAVVGVAVMI